MFTLASTSTFGSGFGFAFAFRFGFAFGFTFGFASTFRSTFGLGFAYTFRFAFASTFGFGFGFVFAFASTFGFGFASTFTFAFPFASTLAIQSALASTFTLKLTFGPGFTFRFTSRSGFTPGAASRATTKEKTQQDPEIQEKVHFAVGDQAAPPSRDVLVDVTKQLVRLSFGTQASIGHEDYLSWVSNLKGMIEGMIDNIKDLAVSSLVSIARRCDLAAKVDETARFVRMLHELYFSAKVNSCLNLMKSKDNSRRPRPSEIYKSLQTHSIFEHKSRDYMSAGSRWAFLANAGSLYLLLVIAFKGEDEYFRKKASVTVIQALCNKIRAPNTSGIMGEIVRFNLILVLTNLCKDIPISIPTLYHKSLLRDLGLSGSFDCGNLVVNDNYFGSFFFHTFRSLPRDWEAWKQFDVSMKSECTLLSKSPLERCFLLFSPEQTGAAQHASAVSELSSEEETFTPPSTVPPISILFNRMGFQSQDLEGIHQVLFTPYKPAKTKEPFPPDYRGRSKWMEKERSLAQDCVTSDSLESYASEMNGGFDSLGQLSDSRYLKLN
ncbi:hypothetical protein F5877DRAFT_86439 [Lentinula edodes]|nr:hypothetical protein F5877DRAFT_86439 [Lentinula edodes]